MYRALIGRSIMSSLRCRNVKTTNTLRPDGALPMALRRRSTAEWPSSSKIVTSPEQSLNLVHRDAVLLALRPIAFVPIETRRADHYAALSPCICPYKYSWRHVEGRPWRDRTGTPTVTQCSPAVLRR